MPQAISAHLPSQDPEQASREASDAIARLVPKVMGEPALLHEVQRQAHTLLGAAVALDDVDAATRALRALRDAGAAIVATTFPQMRTRRFTLDGTPLTLPTQAVRVTGAHAWLAAFQAALVLRDEAASAWFAEVPGGQLLDPKRLAPPYLYMAVNCWRGMYLDAGGWQDLLERAIERGEADADLVAWDQAIGLPELRLLRHVYSGVSELEHALGDALTLHRTYWEARAADLRGQVALGPLAAAVWAHSCGFAIRLDSDYLPRPLFALKG